MGRSRQAGKLGLKFAIGLAGFRGSGKSTLATHLADRYAFSRSSFGGAVRREAVKLGLQPTVEVLQDLGIRLISDWGWAKLCRSVLDETLTQADVVVDGIRHRDAAVALRSLTSPRRFVLVFLDLDENARRARLLRRDGDDGTVRDVHDVESEVASLRSAADFVVRSGAADPAADVVQYLKSIEPTWVEGS
jgi:dephospho-CoA kinase